MKKKNLSNIFQQIIISTEIEDKLGGGELKFYFIYKMRKDTNYLFHLKKKNAHKYEIFSKNITV